MNKWCIGYDINMSFYEFFSFQLPFKESLLVGTVLLNKKNKKHLSYM